MCRSPPSLLLTAPSEYDQSRLSGATGFVPLALNALRCDVLEAVASGGSLSDVVTLLRDHVERLVPDIVFAVLRVDDDARLRLLGPPIPPEMSARLREALAAGLDQAADEHIEAPLHPIRGRDGRVLGALALCRRDPRAPTPLERMIADAAVHLCGVAMERDAVWSRLQKTNERFEVALSNMSQGVCFFDGSRRLIVANRRFSDMYGLAVRRLPAGIVFADMVDLRIEAGTGPKMQREDYLAWYETLRLATTPTDAVVELGNGRMIAIHHQPMPDGGWVATHEDVTERRRAEARIVHLARHDALTGLPNRTLFLNQMEQALAACGRGQTCAALCIDLDRFKAVNDTFGHAAGDSLLRHVARRLQACIREVDTVTRLGGDEFAILLVAIDRPDSAGELAERIVRVLAEPFDLDGHSVSVGTSLGIAIAPHDGATPDRLLRSADTALYRAKLDGRGTYRFFEPDMDARRHARATMERELRGAVDDLAFELEYQPMIDLSSGAIRGFEALLRWRHPTRGVVLPAEFIHLAEETGLIGQLGAWVLRQACQEAMRWPGDLTLAVNISGAQFRNRGLVDTVRDALASSAFPATRLELEITETALLTNNPETLATLHTLRDLGAGISLDDFGTGYSSLSYLRSFPFDRVKIDRSFIGDGGAGPNSLAVIRAVVGLGRSLGMTTAAEGVETREQLAQLRREGCGEAQGFLFGAPTPAAGVHRLLRAGRRDASGPMTT